MRILFQKLNPDYLYTQLNFLEIGVKRKRMFNIFYTNPKKNIGFPYWSKVICYFGTVV